MNSGDGDYCYQPATRTELTVAVFTERILMAIRIVMAAGVFVVVAQVAVVFQEMYHYLRHAHPLVHVHGAEAIEGKGEEKEQAAHGEGQM